MSDVDQLTPEETAAMAEMQQDTAPVTEAEQEAAQQPAPEPVKQPEPTPDPVKPPDGYVPHQALHQERERRKAIEQELADLRAQQTAPAKEPLKVPDPIMEPKEFAEFQRQQAEAQNERWANFERQQQEQVRNEQMKRGVEAAEQAFVKATPDYYDAVSYLQQHRAKELEAYGAGAEQIQHIIGQEVQALINGAVQSGRSPAEVAYGLAKHRGWAGAPAAPAVDHGAQMQAKANAATQTGTLSTAGGPSASGGLTMEAISNMSEGEMASRRDEINKFMSGQA